MYSMCFRAKLKRGRKTTLSKQVLASLRMRSITQLLGSSTTSRYLSIAGVSSFYRRQPFWWDIKQQRHNDINLRGSTIGSSRRYHDFRGWPLRPRVSRSQLSDGTSSSRDIRTSICAGSTIGSSRRYHGFRDWYPAAKSSYSLRLSGRLGSLYSNSISECAKYLSLNNWAVAPVDRPTVGFQISRFPHVQHWCG
jgi:hypothetical protein